MKIYGQLAEQTSRALSLLKRFLDEGYESRDVGQVARDLAAEWERCLKAAFSSPPRSTFYSLTQQLNATNWAGSNALDVVRQTANADKHEAQPSHDIDVLILAINDVNNALPDLLTHAPGLNTEIPAQIRIRQIVCAIYDFFSQGESVYSFFVAGPDDDWMSVKKFEEFQVKSSSCEEIERHIENFERFEDNPSDLKLLEESLRSSDNELWKVMRFRASYAQILELMAPHQHAMNLLPGLHRQDNKWDLVSSLVAAHIQGTEPLLVDRNTAVIQNLEKLVNTFLANVPPYLKPLCLDRCDDVTWGRLEAEAIKTDDYLGALITSRGVVMVRC